MKQARIKDAGLLVSTDGGMGLAVVWRDSVRGFCGFVAFGVVVLNPVPLAFDVHVADHLIGAHAGSELDQLTACAAIGTVAGIHGAGHRAAYGFRGCLVGRLRGHDGHSPGVVRVWERSRELRNVFVQPSQSSRGSG